MPKKNFYRREKKSELTAAERAALEAKKARNKLKRKKRKANKKASDKNGSKQSTVEQETPLPAAQILAADERLLAKETKQLSVLFWNVGFYFFTVVLSMCPFLSTSLSLHACHLCPHTNTHTHTHT